MTSKTNERNHHKYPITKIMSGMAIVFASIIAASQPAKAQQLESELICSSITELSALLFVQHQKGATREQLEKFLGSDDPQIRSILTIALNGAMAVPVLSDQEAAKKVTQFFTASMKLVCLDQYTSNPSQPAQSEVSDDDHSSANSPSNVGTSPEQPDWADSRYPEIDYNSFGFQGLAGGGHKIVGYWGTVIENDRLNEGTITSALNVSNWGDTAPDSQLFVRCDAGELAVGILTDGYLARDRGNKVDVAYRLDGNDPVETRWFAKQGLAAAKGRQAKGFVRELANSTTLFLRITESDGERHDVDLFLQGSAEVMATMAKACSFSLLELTRDDYTNVQALLKAGGFDAGIPDGMWGPSSRRAMRGFQNANGLEPTGLIDRASLSALGFDLD